MSEWDFLWEDNLSEEELMDAISCGMTKFDIEIERQDQKRIKRKAEWDKLKNLRDSGEISKEEFKKRKTALFSNV